ncbi:MAG TPA: acetate--CoA ligase family protein, partial [Gammaproteobacteria bacterium]|nr:acetate--CoA ligase family protein [Gammaproteobacteria bacterium]
DAEYSAALRRAGVLRVATLDELFSAVETLALARPPPGPRLAILTNGGGLGVLGADELLERGGELAALERGTLARLDALLPPAWSRGNPVDIVGDATPERYAAAVRVVLDDPNADGLLVLHCPTAVTPGIDAARAVAAVLAERPGATVLTSWLGEHSARTARDELQARGVPTYDTPEQAVRAFMQMVDYRRNQELLRETPPSSPRSAPPDAEAARHALAGAQAAGRRWLEPEEVRTVLGAYGIPITAAVPAATPRAAGAAAERIGGAVALKIAAEQIPHKSDVGGVELHLTGRAAVEAAASAMLERVRRAVPGAAIRGFSVEPMVERAGALELIVGASAHGDFGPVILFGEGGTAVEAIADTALELPPLNVPLARALIERTRVYERMRGYRGVPAVSVDAVCDVLMRVSQLLVDQPAIVDLDVNPLVASAAGVMALDARIGIAAGAAATRLAICPYPTELEESVMLGERVLSLRPILPEDEPALRAEFSRLAAEGSGAGLFASAGELSQAAAARFTQIDYDREMTLVLTAANADAPPGVHALVRLAANPDHTAAELSLAAEPWAAALGAPRVLLERATAYARSRGIVALHISVPPQATALLETCRTLGFGASPPGAQAGAIRMTLALGRYNPK